MSTVPENLRYAETHEWVEDIGGGRYRVGITDHAQELLGDLVFVELPALGSQIRAGNPCGVLESVKAAADLYAPISGTVAEVNEALGENPQWLNEDPHGRGWIMVVNADATAWDGLLDAAAYARIAEA
ncbi:glycine cleavage system protein GcvH [Acidithiobacillus sulfuriphilus]|uniref:Glycine cleavage system H protein n=2 Tax=Acidithiobacillus sulfuriphilus TaxID=1867749 RepID=A0A3M8RI25_9PROT|nr:glycine cleavage system protein GcvH [Acidithiobacillus sulfuriphilus]RNF67963.1 glycine cleavage system protein GcvH [Acidithiobacillus sulfuriphilus]